MKKFLVIYGMSPETIANFMATATPEQKEEDMKEWVVWAEANQASMVDPGNPAGKNTRVTKDGVQEVSNDIAGYSIMQAESKEAVIAVLQSGPHLAVPGSYTEVMEIVEM